MRGGLGGLDSGGLAVKVARDGPALGLSLGECSVTGGTYIRCFERVGGAAGCVERAAQRSNAEQRRWQLAAVGGHDCTSLPPAQVAALIASMRRSEQPSWSLVLQPRRGGGAEAVPPSCPALHDAFNFVEEARGGGRQLGRLEHKLAVEIVEVQTAHHALGKLHALEASALLRGLRSLGVDAEAAAGVLVTEMGLECLQRLEHLPANLRHVLVPERLPEGDARPDALDSTAPGVGDGALLAALEEKMRCSIATWGRVLRLLQSWETDLVTPQFRYEQAQKYIQRRYEQDLRNHIVLFKRRCPDGSFHGWMATEQCPFHDNLGEFESWRAGNLSAGGTHGWQEFVDMFDSTSAGEALLDARMDTLAMDHVLSADADAWWSAFKRGEVYDMQPLNETEAAISALRSECEIDVL